jgi:alcohol dehydrogenase
MSYQDKWTFFNPTEICFGLKFPEDLFNHVEKKSTLFLTSPGGSKRGITDKVKAIFEKLEINYKILDFANPNPTFEDVKSIQNDLLKFKTDQIISIGGGSVLDLGKILSYTLSPSAPPLSDIFSDLKSGKSLPLVTPISFIACPTTAGTGSEVTPFATIWDMVDKKKYSISSKNLFPTKALLFPELTLTLPWEVTLSTGLDALSQCLESIWNKNYTGFTANFAEKGVKLIFNSLPKLKNDPLDIKSRRDIMEGSLISGLCISQTRTAMAHAISYPLTAHYGTPHGIACSFTLPDLWNYNLKSDDGRMRDFCQRFNFSADEFHQKLLDFLIFLDFQSAFKKTINSQSQILSVSHEMFNPGRSDNNLNAFDKESLRNFLSKASNHWV